MWTIDRRVENDAQQQFGQLKSNQKPKTLLLRLFQAMWFMLGAFCHRPALRTVDIICNLLCCKMFRGSQIEITMSRDRCCLLGAQGAISATVKLPCTLTDSPCKEVWNTFRSIHYFILAC